MRRFVPAGAIAARVDPGRPGATALALVAAAAALVAAAGVWLERPRAEPVDALPAVTAGAPIGQSGPAGSIVVSVTGKVATPGLVTLPDGSRVADAVTAAGGVLAGVDLTGVNLARRLADGEQVVVGAAAPAGGVPGSAVPEGAGSGPGPIDLNLATAAQLDTLPGVGPVTAERIVEWRTRNGPFRRVEQLREVDGIGERRFAQLRALVTVS
ncbi:MAG: helix-hairpin-helix domain-containing protein [Pseudonocardia sp.]